MVRQRRSSKHCQLLCEERYVGTSLSRRTVVDPGPSAGRCGCIPSKRVFGKFRVLPTNELSSLLEASTPNVGLVIHTDLDRYSINCAEMREEKAFELWKA